MILMVVNLVGPNADTKYVTRAFSRADVIEAKSIADKKYILNTVENGDLNGRT